MWVWIATRLHIECRMTGQAEEKLQPNRKGQNFVLESKNETGQQREKQFRTTVRVGALLL